MRKKQSGPNGPIAEGPGVSPGPGGCTAPNGHINGAGDPVGSRHSQSTGGSSCLMWKLTMRGEGWENQTRTPSRSGNCWVQI